MSSLRGVSSGPDSNDLNPGPKKAKRKLKERTATPVYSWIHKQLNTSKSTSGKHNDLIHIILNKDFLITCYQMIKGKPGNMTPGTHTEIDEQLVKEKQIQTKPINFSFKIFNVDEIKNREVTKVIPLEIEINRHKE